MLFCNSQFYKGDAFKRLNFIEDLEIIRFSVKFLKERKYSSKIKLKLFKNVFNLLLKYINCSTLYLNNVVQSNLNFLGFKNLKLCVKQLKCKNNVLFKHHILKCYCF